MRKPVFLLGVGAPKAGTTFLYKALTASGRVRLSTPKEMHVLDAHFVPEHCGQFHARRKKALLDLMDDGQRVASRSLVDPMRHVLMVHDLDFYLAYFRGLAQGVDCTGEITPSYTFLQEDHFRAARDLLADAFDVRVVFLMRDPLDRIFSAMRMEDRNTGREKNLAHERFGREYAYTRYEFRTRYDYVITRLERVFPPDSIYYGFYEELFTPERFNEICHFLGVNVPEPDFSQRVNASPVQGGVAAAASKEVREYYDPVYRFCAERFGDGRISSLWSGYRGVVA